MRHTIERLRGEFLETPGLRLTAAQVQRLCGLDETMCHGVLDALVDVGFLRTNRDGTYARTADGQRLWPGQATADRPLNAFQPSALQRPPLTGITSPRPRGIATIESQHKSDVRAKDSGDSMSEAAPWPDDVATDILCAGRASVPVLLSGGTAATRLAAALEVEQVRGLIGPFVVAHPSALPATQPCTVYFEEIAVFSAIEQQALTRWLDAQKIYGSACTRVISATGNNVFEAVSAGRFDAALFYRLNVIHVRLAETVS